MQQRQTLNHPNASRTSFVPLCSRCPCTSVSSLSRPGLSSLRPLNRARQTVARRQRVRISAEQAQPSSGSSSDETRAESSSDVPKQVEEDDDDVQITIPNAFEVSGDPGCVQCTGKGEIDCPVCDAKGFFTLSIMDTVSSSQCRMCSGRKIIPCPTCRQIVFKSVLWWDQIPSTEEDPEEKWRDGPDGPKFGWGENPAGS